MGLCFNPFWDKEDSEVLASCFISLSCRHFQNVVGIFDLIHNTESSEDLSIWGGGGKKGESEHGRWLSCLLPAFFHLHPSLPYRWSVLQPHRHHHLEENWILLKVHQREAVATCTSLKHQLPVHGAQSVMQPFISAPAEHLILQVPPVAKGKNKHSLACFCLSLEEVPCPWYCTCPGAHIWWPPPALCLSSRHRLLLWYGLLLHQQTPGLKHLFPTVWNVLQKTFFSTLILALRGKLPAEVMLWGALCRGWTSGLDGGEPGTFQVPIPRLHWSVVTGPHDSTALGSFLDLHNKNHDIMTCTTRSMLICWRGMPGNNHCFLAATSPHCCALLLKAG